MTGNPALAYRPLRDPHAMPEPDERPYPPIDDSGPQFDLVPFDQIKVGTARSYLVKGLVPRVGLTVLWGPPKCGKSFVAHDLLMHVAMGWEFRGRRVAQGAVVLIAAEGAEGWRARIEAWRQRHLAEDAAAVPFYLLSVPVDLIADYAAVIAAIREQVGDGPVVAVGVDTLNRTLRGSESNDEDMAAYVRAADAIKVAFGCAVVVVHHCGWDDKRPRGHSSLLGALDCQIAIRKADDGVIAAEVEFMKDGPEGAVFLSRLETVEVGRDEDDDPITSCVVAPVEGDTATPRRGQLKGKQRQGMESLRDTIIAEGQPAPAGNPDYPTSETVVAEISAWRERMLSNGTIDRAGSNPRRAFKQILDGLKDKGAIGIWNDHVWITEAGR